MICGFALCLVSLRALFSESAREHLLPFCMPMPLGHQHLCVGDRDGPPRRFRPGVCPAAVPRPPRAPSPVTQCPPPHGVPRLQTPTGPRQGEATQCTGHGPVPCPGAQRDAFVMEGPDPKSVPFVSGGGRGGGA